MYANISCFLMLSSVLKLIYHANRRVRAHVSLIYLQVHGRSTLTMCWHTS